MLRSLAITILTATGLLSCTNQNKGFVDKFDQVSFDEFKNAALVRGHFIP